MYYFMTQAHSGWQHLASLALVVAVAVYVVNWLRGQMWSPLYRRIGLYAIIVIDIQLLLGLTLWGVGASMGIVGANALRTVEHPFTMLLAIVLLHAGWVWTKRSDETVRLRNGAVTFLVTGLLVLLGLLRIWGIV
ncbi:MAG: hypothetical protein F4047_12190 [Caldilineaceae bacterium SB0670_bin_27]|uniref:TIGR03987 family protein n=1 Tax=Caldilineaceae bacterium SB0664_bin_27 TaxID=2605260 RepID=A0A6B0YPS6_9CHLR|nr:hypothetical protein [Caldilineaceae bacterium]MDE0337776.1 hypothetical protein [Caldilineaceae bacterium]MXY91842.1 hypothetical protein [Caldilineaceae bacterium SB0664_bin_27]MYJ78872.1 hypothetical protein [Caldilineaceae bacterium SB0670_bin_27]